MNSPFFRSLPQLLHILKNTLYKVSETMRLSTRCLPEYLIYFSLIGFVFEFIVFNIFVLLHLSFSSSFLQSVFVTLCIIAGTGQGNLYLLTKFEDALKGFGPYLWVDDIIFQEWLKKKKDEIFRLRVKSGKSIGFVIIWLLMSFAVFSIDFGNLSSNLIAWVALNTITSLMYYNLIVCRNLIVVLIELRNRKLVQEFGFYRSSHPVISKIENYSFIGGLFFFGFSTIWSTSIVFFLISISSVPMSYISTIITLLLFVGFPIFFLMIFPIFITHSFIRAFKKQQIEAVYLDIQEANETYLDTKTTNNLDELEKASNYVLNLMTKKDKLQAMHEWSSSVRLLLKVVATALSVSLLLFTLGDKLLSFFHH